MLCMYVHIACESYIARSNIAWCWDDSPSIASNCYCQPPQPLEQPQKEADDEKEHWQPHLSNWVEALSWQLSIRLAEGVGWWWLVGKLEKRRGCHRGWGRPWRPWRLLQCSGGSIQGVVNVFREPLWRTDDVWRLLFRLPRQASQAKKKKTRSLSNQLWNTEKGIQAFFFYAMPSKQPSTLYYYYIYTEACASVELHYAM